MPKQVLPTQETFAQFETRMRAYGFGPITREQFADDFHRLRLRAPRPRLGHEAGFQFSAKGLTVCVWTTWLREEGVARKQDAGWVLIKEGDAPLYFRGPMHRTRYFFERMAGWALVSAWKVAHRPHCPACNAFMKIVNGPELKDRYWQCNRLEEHSVRGLTGPMAYRWDIGLPELAQKFVDAERAKRIPHDAACRAAGKNPYAAMLARKLWGQGEP
jgi:hypothetical protein